MQDVIRNVVNSQDVTISYPFGFAALPTVDWLAFTIHPQEFASRPYERPLKPGDDILFLKSALAAYFGGGLPLPAGLNGYQSSLSIVGTGRICWHEDRPEMGVHVILPSTALTRHAQIKGGSVYDLLYDMSSRGAKFTRIDLAIDSDAVQMSAVVHAHETDLTVTKAQKSQLIKDYKSGGLTLYIGARQGRRMVRFYDKAAKEGASGVWTRCEVELKHEHAITAVNHLLGGSDPCELILASIDFRLDPDNKQTDRRTRCDWWQDWVGVATKVTFPIAKAAASVADAMAWVVKQVGPTLSFLTMYMGNAQWLADLAKDAADRVPDWKWDLLPDHRFGFASQGVA